MTDITHSPALPAPNYQVAVTFALTESGSDFLRVWCTSAPTGSRLDSLINSSRDPRSRVEVFEGTPAQTYNTTFDKGGKYTFVAQEYSKGYGYGGGYQGDPKSVSTEIKKGPESTLTLHVGQRVTQPIGPPGNQATLVLWVWDNQIEGTTKAFHGEDSPAIVSASPTPKVKTAMESPAVVAALAALRGQDATDSTVVGYPKLWLSGIYNAFKWHVLYSDMHVNEDTFNFFPPTYGDQDDEKAVLEFCNYAIRTLTKHVTNDTGTAPDPLIGPQPVGADSGNFHQVDGGESGFSNVSDRASIPLYSSVGTFAEAYGCTADLVRCLRRHTVNLDVHTSLSPISIGPSLSLLMRVHTEFLSVIASALPEIPPAQSTGVHYLISNGGFKEG